VFNRLRIWLQGVCFDSGWISMREDFKRLGIWLWGFCFENFENGQMATEGSRGVSVL